VELHLHYTIRIHGIVQLCLYLLQLGTMLLSAVCYVSVSPAAGCMASSQFHGAPQGPPTVPLDALITGTCFVSCLFKAAVSIAEIV
jgi:hypothetical protein